MSRDIFNPFLKPRASAEPTPKKPGLLGVTGDEMRMRLLHGVGRVKQPEMISTSDLLDKIPPGVREKRRTASRLLEMANGLEEETETALPYALDVKIHHAMLADRLQESPAEIVNEMLAYMERHGTCLRFPSGLVADNYLRKFILCPGIPRNSILANKARINALDTDNDPLIPAQLAYLEAVQSGHAERVNIEPLLELAEDQTTRTIVELYTVIGRILVLQGEDPTTLFVNARARVRTSSRGLDNDKGWGDDRSTYFIDQGKILYEAGHINEVLEALKDGSKPAQESWRLLVTIKNDPHFSSLPIATRQQIFMKMNELTISQGSHDYVLYQAELADLERNLTGHVSLPAKQSSCWLITHWSTPPGRKIDVDELLAIAKIHTIWGQDASTVIERAKREANQLGADQSFVAWLQIVEYDRAHHLPFEVDLGMLHDRYQQASKVQIPMTGGNILNRYLALLAEEKVGAIPRVLEEIMADMAIYRKTSGLAPINLEQMDYYIRKDAAKVCREAVLAIRASAEKDADTKHRA